MTSDTDTQVEAGTSLENGAGGSDELRYCKAPPRTLPVLSPEMTLGRMRAIVVTRVKWVNGTTLLYHFLEGPEAQRQVVRSSFDEWKGLGIGLEFTEVDDPAEAEVRIAFDQSDGSWSYLGRDVLSIGSQQATMNFGWDLTTPYGRTTALHEIGHTLGKPHEHQNPMAGIVWDEEAVYARFGAPPNSWDRDTTFRNILRKLDVTEVEGSPWDQASIMHYAFPGGLIKDPEPVRGGISPPGTLSEVDKNYVRMWYPPLGPAAPPLLEPFVSHALHLTAGQQADFRVEPTESRTYRIGTFGESDAVLVLFEKVDGEWRYRSGDDDSGESRNALVEEKLFKGGEYLVRLRLYSSWASGHTAVMLW
jgi:hypothetical protein